MYPQNQPVLDFDIIDTHNELTIGIADTSLYPSGFTIVSPTLQILPPGFPLVTMAYTPNAAVFLNSNNLNITCVDDNSLLSNLPDGIWDISISVSPAISYTKTKTFLRTLNMQKLLGQAFLKTNMTQCDLNVRNENMKVLDEIYYYVQAAIAAANQCNNQLAIDLYQTASIMVNNFLNGRCRGYSPLYC